ncbi:acetyl-CoA carboxylase biotin carboxylase subunit family protein [Amycolatopsis sp. MtRt-6]|uniref:ATP-grasp domain-containing protein n=1 Tax=Amycolatopsis sp. MtRt-6 TaxID=2792782 RepID=UPI001A90B41A|nr:ATP-grasp domain-containing protein [Amycolatopsis sp. MtRt-6]
MANVNSGRTGRPRLIVMFEEGAVTPAELVLSLTDWADLMLVVGTSPYAVAMKPFLDEIADTLTWDQPRAELLDHLRTWRPDGITTYAERMLVPTAEVAAELGLSYYSMATVNLLRDKFAQRKRLAEAGVQRTKSVSLPGADQWPEVAAEVGFPLVVKPRVGEGSQYTHLIHSVEQGETVLRDLAKSYRGPLIAEEFIVGKKRPPLGDYVSVESCVVDGTIRHLGITGKFDILPPFREQGGFWPAPVSDAERAEILDLAQRALSNLDIMTGMIHTEVKLTADGPRVIEVNGRIGGQINDMSSRASGIDIIDLGARIALGMDTDDIVAAKPDKVYFQFHNSPPLDAHRLTWVQGAEAVKKVPGVTSYEIFLHPPASLEKDFMTRWIDVVRGEARDHDDMVKILDEANELLSFGYEVPSGEITLPAMWTQERTRRATPGCPA